MADLEEIRRYITEELTPARERGKYFCPLCGSGKGARGTAALSINPDKVHWKCFSCNESGDLFDLIAKRDGISIQEATRAAIEKYGSPLDRYHHRPSTPSKPQKPETVEEQGRDFTAEIKRFHEAISGSAGEKYLNRRGITTESINRFSLGFDERRQQVIIPYNKRGSYYGMRNIAPDARHAHDKPAGTKAPLFNAAALYGESPCFVVESPLCAISIMQEGGSALALGGTAYQLLQREAERKFPSAPLILCLDNDQPKEDGRRPGQEAQAQLAAWLMEKKIPFIEANVAGDCKDPNEALQADPAALRERIREAVEAISGESLEAIKRQQQLEGQEQLEKYQGEAASGFMDAFLEGVSASAATPPIPTGFYSLDKLLEGGLYEGLYTVGAISSLGKTSFILQMCDQIAASGHDVLFFSLEMGRYELMAKSISRFTRIITGEQHHPANIAKTTRGILSGKRYEKYSKQELEIIAQASDRYKEMVSSRIWFIEGIGNIGTAEVRLQVERHIHLTGHRPVVVIDYLQILAPADVRASDKQNTDRNVLELKRMSRDFKIPVIGISSLNRDNYTEPINTAAFKESGAIEYGSDCLIGLQYIGMEWQEGEKEQARNKRIRELFASNDEKARKGDGVEIEVKILKNRNGGRGTSDPLLFYPMFNLFREHPARFTLVDTETPFSGKVI